VVVTGRLEQRSWEIEDGETRSKVELVAEEIGASLRFATVDIHKVGRHTAADEIGGETNPA
jgi:single-strand DNA-binding protein